LVAQKLQP